MDINKIKYEPWKVVRLIGQGSFGSVYEIEREEFGEKYKAALKVISIPQNENEIVANRADGMDDLSMTSYYNSVVQELTHEFALLSKVKGHTNIVGYEDHKVVPHDNGIGWDIYIRMEMLNSLTTVSSTYNFSREEVIKIGIDICKALEICEKKGIIHRDIKPDNIFISEAGDFKLGDFGIARTASKGGTMYNMSKKGTPNYMAPEVYKNEPYNNTVDIYSLGIVLYQLMNNKRIPFIPKQMSMSDRETALGRRMSGEPFPLPENGDRAFNDIILKACSYNPQNRYQRAEDMRNELMNLIGGREPASLDYDATVIGTREPSYFEKSAPKVNSAINTMQNGSINENQNMQFGQNPNFNTNNNPNINTQFNPENTQFNRSNTQYNPDNTQFNSDNTQYNPNNTQFGSDINNQNKKGINPLYIAIGIGAVAVLLIIILLFTLLGNKKTDQNDPTTETQQEATTEEATTEETTTATTEAANNAVSLADASWDDYMFTLEGVTYKLPVSYSDFKESGWKITDASEDDTLDGEQYKYVNATDGKHVIEINIYNGSGNTRKLSECNVCGVDVDKDCKVSFIVAKNMTLGNSVEDIENAYGAPTQIDESNEYTCLQYYNGADYWNGITFFVDKPGDDYDYTDIKIEYQVKTVGDETQVSNDVPEYLSTYVAPTELGNDLTSMNLSIDNVLYRLPCPLSELLNNGWKISEKSIESLNAGEESGFDITLKKGDYTLEPVLKNFDSKACTVENTAVIYFRMQYMDYLDGNKNIFGDCITLPGNYSIFSTADDCNKLGNEFEFIDYSDNDNKDYWYKFCLEGKDINFIFNICDDYSSFEIDYENINWDY